MTRELIEARYRAATLTTRQFANETSPSIVNHRRIERVMDSVQELAVLTADEIHGDEENALGVLETEVLKFIEARVIGLATDIEAAREARQKVAS